MRQHGLALALALCAALLAPCAARAEGSSLVTVVRPPHAGELALEATARLAGELRAAGFAARIIEGAAGKGGRGDGAFATIAILETSRGAIADVWVADPVLPEPLIRIAEVEAGRAGLPLFLPSIGLSATF